MNFSADQANQQLAKLPPLNPTILYFNDFDDTPHILENVDTRDLWLAEFNAHTLRFKLEDFPENIREIARRALAFALQRWSPLTVHGKLYRDIQWGFDTLGYGVMLAPFHAYPMELKFIWENEIFPKLVEHGKLAVGLKQYLRFFCHYSLGHLNPDYADFISSFSSPHQDLYASVSDPSTFLDSSEELAIINYLDELTSQSKISFPTLRKACVLICSFQYGMRPRQIAKVKKADVSFKLNGELTHTGPIVHIRFQREKQRDGSKRTPLLRNMKREWSNLFTRYAAASDKQVHKRNRLSDVYFFGMGPESISELILNATKPLCSMPRSATHLRHTAAQRLVDAGATHVELAEFLGQSAINTGLVYYTKSATQTERLNKALAASPIYTAIAKINRTKTIDSVALEALTSDQQIGGIAHGVPIAGIGGCSIGQSLCVKNPVLACYGCLKFMPLSDVSFHETVLNTLRSVVRRFFDSSLGETQSPAYTQLRRTIEAIERIIFDIKESRIKNAS